MSKSSASPGQAYLLRRRVSFTLLFVLIMQVVTALLTGASAITFVMIVGLGVAGLLFVRRLLTIQARKIITLNTQLQSAMHEGNYVSTLSAGQDEVGMLIESFTSLISHNTKLFEAQYQMRDNLKKAELQVLQAQINPHFLYNTLDMIHWLALRHGVADISRAVENLSRFYRFSLGMGEGKVPIEKELMHVQAYINVQNIRYGDKITLKISIPNDLMHFHIVKIVLQPLVENCIQHGLRAKESGCGTIEIATERTDEGIRFTVWDDGAGMDAERLEAIRTGTIGKIGYGVDNINQRLILNYGEQHGLVYQSVLGVGTTVTFSIPFESPLEQIENMSAFLPPER